MLGPRPREPLPDESEKRRARERRHSQNGLKVNDRQTGLPRSSNSNVTPVIGYERMSPSYSPILQCLPAGSRNSKRDGTLTVARRLFPMIRDAGSEKYSRERYKRLKNKSERACSMRLSVLCSGEEGLLQQKEPNHIRRAKKLFKPHATEDRAMLPPMCSQRGHGIDAGSP